MKILLTFILLSLSQLTFSQQNHYNRAEKLYHAKAYADAVVYYEDVLARGFDSLILANHITESYDKSVNAKKALAWYKYQERNILLDRFEYIRYSMLLCSEAKYSEAEEKLLKSEALFGLDSLTRRMKQELAKFIGSTFKPANFLVKEIKGNSTKSEISVFPIDSVTAVFSSTRKQKVTIRRYNAINNEPMYDLFIANYDTTGFSNVKRFDENTKFHEGSSCIDTLNGLFYFTRNNYVNGEIQRDSLGNMLLKLYQANFIKGKLENVLELPFNSNTYSCAHPAISQDGRCLVFSSNMRGGYGGMDLYKVMKDSLGVFGKPVNLGNTINTEFNELFPYFHQKDKAIFFSSNGHYGYGGLDVFVAILNRRNEVRTIENIGQPLNTTSDDFAFINDLKQKKGYVSSDRSSGIGFDDIYSFTQFSPYKSTVTIKGYVTNLLTGDTISNARISVKLEGQNDSISVIAKENGSYELELDVEEDFEIVASKEGFEIAHIEVAFDSTKLGYEENVVLMPEMDYFVSGVVRDKDTKEVLADVKVTIVDLLNGDTISILATNLEGYFKSNILRDKKYKDSICISLYLEKTGYISTTYSLREMLDVNEEIDVNAFIGPILTKVDLGSDLAKLIELQPIYYDYMKWSIRADAALELDKIYKVLKENPAMKIELISHTDTRGDSPKNLILSKKRAKSAMDYIVAKGIDKKRITTKGLGESLPVISNLEIEKLKTWEEKEVAHQTNRRTVFNVVKL
jgi:outer membrane protein OmpA-like peptidoglycan-associated protein